MIVIRHTTEIRASPEQIFEWLTNLNKNYRAWHPKDHIECRYIKGSLVERNSIVYFEQYLHEHLEKMKFKITNVKPNSRIEYKIMFPYSLLGVGGSLTIEPSEAGSLFTTEVRLGGKNTLLERLWDKFIQIFFGLRLEALKQHMSEEGHNLKRIMEKDI